MPYDPENDDYNVRAFNKPIETTKATAIQTRMSTGRRSRTRPSGNISATTRSRATSCSTHSVVLAERLCQPCWTAGKASPLIAARLLR